MTAEVGDATTSSQYSASRQSVACLGIASPPYIHLHRRRPYIYSCIYGRRQQTQWSCVRTLGHLRRTAEKTNEWVLDKAGLKRELLDECRTQARRPQARRDTSPPVTSPPDTSPPQGGHKPARGGSKARHLTQDCLTGRLVYKISNYIQGSLRLSQC